MTSRIGAPDESWTLTPEDHALGDVQAPSHAARLRCWPSSAAAAGSRGSNAAVEPRVIDALGEQLDAPAPAGDGELLTARTAERFRAEIRACFGFREATVADALIVWLRDHAAPEAAGALDVLVERLETRCREQALKPPAPDRIDRIVRAAQRAHLDRFHTAVYERLSPAAHGRLDELLLPEIDEGEQSVAGETAGSAPGALLRLSGSPGRPSLASLQEELTNLELARRIELPPDLFDHFAERERLRLLPPPGVLPPQHRPCRFVRFGLCA